MFFKLNLIESLDKDKITRDQGDFNNNLRVARGGGSGSPLPQKLESA